MPDLPRPSYRHVAVIERWQLYRVIDLPGLVSIDLDRDVATLFFATAPGAQPIDASFLLSELGRMGASVSKIVTLPSESPRPGEFGDGGTITLRWPR